MTPEQIATAEKLAAELCGGGAVVSKKEIAAVVAPLPVCPPIPRVGLVEVLNEALYHADPCASPSLSSSLAHKLVTKSPAHAYLTHPRLGNHRGKESKSMSDGSIIHAMLLGGAELTDVGHDNYRTKEAKARRANAIALGNVPVTSSEFERFGVAVEAIRKQLVAHSIKLGPGDGRICEVSVFWEAKTSDGEVVQCRGRIDQLEIFEGGALITDLKSTRSAHPDKIERSVEDFGYDIQRAAYVEAIETIYPHLAGRVQYQWIFVEATPPYVVTPSEPTGELAQLGERRWQYAVDKWAKCLLTDEGWPGYVAPGEMARIAALPWAVAREMERV